MDAQKIAEARLKLKSTVSKQNALKETVDEMEAIKLKKIGKANDFIIRTISKYFNDKKPISKANLKKIVELADRYKIVLTYDVIRAFNENRKNISEFFSYFERRVVNLFQILGYVRNQDDELYKIELINTLVKIKKGILNIPDLKIKETKLFLDFNSVVEASKIFLWYSKVMECEPINQLNDEELKSRYSKILERYCKIANQPIKVPIDDTPIPAASVESNQKISDDDGDYSNEDDDATEETKIEEDNDDDDDESKTNTEQPSTTNTEQPSTTNEAKNISDDSKQSNEQFTQNLYNSTSDIVNKITNSDYHFIIGTSLFIFILFFIYLRYKN